MKSINFCNTGEAVSDFNVSNWVDEMLASNEPNHSTSTHLVINEIRARIKEGRITLSEISVTVDGEVFPVDKNGRSAVWYPSQEVGETILMRIL